MNLGNTCNDEIASPQYMHEAITARNDGWSNEIASARRLFALPSDVLRNDGCSDEIASTQHMHKDIAARNSGFSMRLPQPAGYSLCLPPCFAMTVLMDGFSAELRSEGLKSEPGFQHEVMRNNQTSDEFGEYM